MRKIILVALTLLLPACSLPRPASPAEALPATETPADHPCAFTWATQPLPEVSEKVQTAMDKAGLKDITVRAEAYGENCVDAQTNEVVSFGALETDLHMSVEVADLADEVALGNLAERILVVLDGFPPGSTPGPEPGYIGIHFTQGDQELNLWFLAQDGKAARGEGLHGRELFERLKQK